MRVTNGMLVNNLMRNLNRNLSRMEKSQQSLASGKKFVRPSDDPIGVSRSLRLNTEVAVMDQYKRNAGDVQSWLNTTELAIDNINDILQRAKELTVQAVNETNSLTERKAIAEEIHELRNQLIQIGNSTYAGSYIFSGFKTDKPLLDKNGNYDIGGGTSKLSLGEVIEINIGIGDRIGANTVGQRIFGLSADPADLDKTPINSLGALGEVNSGDSSQLIAVFDKLIEDLKADSTEDIRKALSRLDIHADNVNTIRAEIGVKTNRVELTTNRIEDDTLNLKELLSKNEDADMAEVIMNLLMQENVYNASLSGGARIIQPSLVDFLR